MPASEGARPWAILTLTVVGRDDAHAEALATPWRLALARHATGDSSPLLPVEAALAYRPTPAERAAQSAPPLNDLRAEVVGGPGTVAAKLKSFVAESGADEVMVVTDTYDPGDRREPYTRLAELAGLGGL